MRKFQRNPLDEAYAEITRLSRTIDQMLNNKETTLPFRAADNLPPGVEGQIVLANRNLTGSMLFMGASHFDGLMAVYSISELDGTITELSSADFSFGMWSRDRTKIYQAKTVSATELEIWSSTPKGTNRTLLMHLTGLDELTSGILKYSLKDTLADGIQMLYTTPASPSEIRLYNVEDSTFSVIFTTSALPTGYTNKRPGSFQWNPDGDKVSFIVEAPTLGHYGLFTMDTDGSNLEGPILDYYTDMYPLGAYWSVDNVIAHMGPNPTFEIWTINPDGTGNTQLTAYECSAPVWSPDGTKITFTRSSDYLTKIMNDDGTGLVSVPGSNAGTTDTSPYGLLSWSPDGTKIARLLYDPGKLVIIDVASATVDNVFDLETSQNFSLQWDNQNNYFGGSF